MNIHASLLQLHKSENFVIMILMIVIPLIVEVGGINTFFVNL